MRKKTVCALLILASLSMSDLVFSQNWIEQFNDTRVSGGYNDYFGYQVAIDGDYAIAGYKSGATIFKRTSGTNQWQEFKEISLYDPGSVIDGYSVAISGDVAVVGCYHLDSVWIFYKDQDGPDNWGMVTSFSDDYPLSGQAFGCSVDIDGEIKLPRYRLEW